MTEKVPVTENSQQLPSVVRLSASAIRRFQSCPKQFWFADIERASRDESATPQLTLANAVHESLALLHGLPVEQRTGENAERALRSVWPRLRSAETFATKDEEAAYGREALTMLRGYVERYDLSITPLIREEWLQTRLANGLTLIGKVDRIDAAGDGAIELIDYKTGRKNLEDEDLSRDVAVIVYLLLAEAAYQHPVSRVRLIYLRTGEEAHWQPEREDADEAKRRLLELIDEITATSEFIAQPGRHCRWCPFALRCPDRQRVELDALIPVEGLPF